MKNKTYIGFLLLCLVHFVGITNPVSDSLKSEFKRLNRAFNKVIFTDSELAKPYADTYSYLANMQQAKKFQVNALMQYATYYKSQNRIDSALFFGYQSLNASRSMDGNPYLFTIYNSIGLIYEDAGKLDSALHYYELSLATSELVNNRAGVVRAYINIGLTQELKREYKQSIIYLTQALAKSKEYDYIPYFPVIYYNLGKVYESINDLENAIKHYKRSLKVSLNNKYKNRYRNAAIAISKLYLKQEKYDSATHYVQLAHRYDANISDADKYELLLAESELNLQNGNLPVAINDLQQAILFFQSQNDSFNLFTSYVKLAKAHQISGNYYSSLGYAKKAQTIGESVVDDVYFDELSQVFYKDYSALGNTTLALVNLEKYNSIKSGKRSADELKQVVREELFLDYQQKIMADSIQDAAAIEMIQFRHQQEVAKEKASKQKLFYVLIIMALFGVVLFWALRNKQRSEKELAHKNKLIEQALKDKEVLMNEIHHRVKNNMQMVSSLLQLKASATSDKEAENALVDSQKRIESMQLAHQKMYQNADFENIVVTEYAEDILNSLTGIIANDSDCFKVSGEALKLPIEKAQAVGFILHELITNSLKYAWTEAENRHIEIRFLRRNTQVSLLYRDNGKGFNADANKNKKGSLGGKLINSFVSRKLRGTLIQKEASGAHYLITFDLNE